VERPIIVRIYKKDDKTACSNCQGIPLFSSSYKILANIPLSRFCPATDKILGISSVGFDITEQLLINFFFNICQILEKKWGYNETEYQLFIDFMKAYDSVWKEAWYSHETG
jgi:hypothetical protein